ncbi:hypothetical protein CAPTEDRAFT_222037 [Capitella teleta]|uniref:Sorting nexin-13 n=1 Tax=Capitella teleta TaxID=283909 RepID=R7TMT3_CAPTE|nr:hypothetical protein CAPTEDRAFT_222037 [Capitella teleta]|eukprot:ELT94954.1 hypothetical protein CAPTEDRAFT_222037 [Capitella teleta]
MVVLYVTMALSLGACGWGVLAAALFFSSFGATGGLWLLFYLLCFILGFILMLIIRGKQKSVSWLRETAHMTVPMPSIGLPSLVEYVRKGQQKYRMDKRMTGSSIIDDVLQEVLDYTYRDYINSWYKKISDDEQFRYDIRMMLHRVVIAFSERAKEVDLIPYLTTNLVDDFASHIRLYRRTLTKVRENQKDESKPPADIECTFFDLEKEMENKTMCRDAVCLDEDGERQYLSDLSEVLLFLLLPPEDFHNKPFRYIIREVLVSGILLPAFNLLSDPDYINQTISWLCKEQAFNNESFLTIIRSSDNVEELEAIREKIDLDIARQRSRDSGGEDDTAIKQQLNSLLFVKSTCESRILRLKDGLEEPEYSLAGGFDISKLMVPGQKLYLLPFDVILNNNVALSCFIEFMSNVGGQGYLFFYLTIERFQSASKNLLDRWRIHNACLKNGYRVSAEQQLSAVLQAGTTMEHHDVDAIRDAALSIYDQYLSEKASACVLEELWIILCLHQASPRLHLDETLVKTLLENIQHQDASDTVFDEIQAKVWDILQNDPKYFPAFCKSQLYIKLLAELDLLREGSSGENMSGGDTASGSSSRAQSVEDLATSSCESMTSLDPSIPVHSSAGRKTSESFTVSAVIANTGICREHGKAYAVYLITVTRQYTDGRQETWDVYRRYSDFHDLHMTIQDKYESLSGLALPSKKAFNNMHKDFLEKRKLGLNAYLQALMKPSILTTYRGLPELVYGFLENLHWEREKSELARKMDTFVNPLKSSVKSVGSMVKSMPDNFVDGVAKMSGGIRSIPNNMLDGVGKILNVKGGPSTIPSLLSALIFNEQPPGALPPSIKAEIMDSGKVGASILGAEDEEIIPLRIMLLMMDEVFDLKANQWMRRRIVAILRQIVKTMFGDSINRKIVEHVEWMMSAEQISEYIKTFRDSFWPTGLLAEARPKRDPSTKMRTRVVCKAKMFGSVTDELKTLIGTDNSKHGVLRVFNMFQHQALNKRLVCVILEALLLTMFPDNKFAEVFRKIHSRSPRVRGEDSANAA